MRRYEPVGVVAAITPYNGAIIMAFQKLIPALMAGKPVVTFAFQAAAGLPAASALAAGSRVDDGFRRGNDPSCSAARPWFRARGPGFGVACGSSGWY